MSLRRRSAILAWARLPSCASVLAQDVQAIEHPCLGTTLIRRTMTSPRPLSIRILKVDLAAPGIAFRLTPQNGSKDTVSQTALAFLVEQGAQFAVNAHFFDNVRPIPVEQDLLGVAASDGNVYSPFYTPTRATRPARASSSR